MPLLRVFHPGGRRLVRLLQPPPSSVDIEQTSWLPGLATHWLHSDLEDNFMRQKIQHPPLGAAAAEK